MASWLIRIPAKFYRFRKVQILVYGLISTPLVLLILTEVNIEESNMGVRDAISSFQMIGDEMEKIQTRGFERAQFLRQKCDNMTDANRNLSEEITVRLSKDKKILNCPTYKVGSTFWRRIFAIESLDEYRHLKNPFLIPASQDFEAGKISVMELKNESYPFKFIFVRDPYSRLLSAYVDKILAPDYYHWQEIGLPAIRWIRKSASNTSLRCGHDLSFSEFIQHVIKAHEENRHIDPHFVRISDNCQVCQGYYHFVGKMETFRSDSLFILDKLKLQSMKQLMKFNMSNLAEEDAVLDSVDDAFQPSFTPELMLKCIPLEEVFKREWRKLQIRGLIGKHKFICPNGNSIEVIQEQFLSSVQKARTGSTEEERRQTKREAFRELYRTVPVTYLEKIRQIYRTDFELFKYDDRPASVFDREAPFISYGYLNVTV